MPLSAASHSSLFLRRPSSLRPTLCHLPLAAHCFLPCKPSSSLSTTPRLSSLLRRVSHPASAAPEAAEGTPFPPSAAAIAGFIRLASPAFPVEFTQRVERHGKNVLVLPSPDFQRLCMEQLDLFRAVVDPHAILSVYVRPAGSYVMDQLELRRITFYPGVEMPQSDECVILVGNFSIPGGLHAAEIAISKQEVQVAAEFGAIVFPLVKHPFVVGFLVAELPKINVAKYATCEAWELPGFKEEFDGSYGQLTSEKRLRAVMISRSLATAYVMDQMRGPRSTHGSTIISDAGGSSSSPRHVEVDVVHGPYYEDLHNDPNDNNCQLGGFEDAEDEEDVANEQEDSPGSSSRLGGSNKGLQVQKNMER